MRDRHPLRTAVILALGAAGWSGCQPAESGSGENMRQASLREHQVQPESPDPPKTEDADPWTGTRWLWEGEFEGKKLAFWGKPGAGMPVATHGASDSENESTSWKFQPAPTSEWQIRNIRLRRGRLGFECRQGNGLLARTLRFDSAFVPEHPELQGTLLDGARSHMLRLRRRAP